MVRGKTLKNDYLDKNRKNPISEIETLSSKP